MKIFDKHSFKSFFEEHYQSFKNFLYYKTGDLSVAQDLAQEAFLKVWEKRNEVDPNTAKSYLFTIGNNMAINHGKHEQVKLSYKNEQSGTLKNTSENPEEVLRQKEFRKRLQDAISSIPEPFRETFLMNRVDKLKHKEIAERLGLSEKGVQKRLKKALEILNQKIEYRL